MCTVLQIVVTVPALVEIILAAHLL